MAREETIKGEHLDEKKIQNKDWDRNIQSRKKQVEGEREKDISVI